MGDAPLDGRLVVDLTRMLPGAVTSRMLLDLGARVIKVEQPGIGDPMRWAPPLVDGVGAGFRAFLAGAESICLDLRAEQDVARLRRLVLRCDVLIESFRPGRLDDWGLAPDALLSDHPTLVGCSLSAYGRTTDVDTAVAHDLNVTARSGLLSLLSTASTDSLPRTQFADVAGGVLACTAILGALVSRATSGKGCWIDQPLHTSLLPFVAWPLIDTAFGGGGLNDGMLAGRAAAYRLYRCADGQQVALAALEPKFWTAFLEMVGLSEAPAAGLDLGPSGEAAAARVGEALLAKPAAHWVSLASERDLPLTLVNDRESVRNDELMAASLGARQGGAEVPAAGPFLPGWGSTDTRSAPRLGEHGDTLVAEFGLDGD